MPLPKIFVTMALLGGTLSSAAADSDRSLNHISETQPDSAWYVLAVEQLPDNLAQLLVAQLNAMPAPDPKLDAREALVRQSGNPPRFAANARGIALRSADGRYRLRLNADMQFDGRTFNDTSPAPPDAFLVRRARPVVTGALGSNLDFRFMPDFGGGKAQILDAYGDVHFTSVPALRAGQFKVPLGLEQLQNDTNLVFMERSLVSDLLPNREDGVQLFGVLAKRLQWQLALLNGAPDGGSSGLRTPDGATGMARLLVIPFVTSQQQRLRGLGFGIAASQGRSEGKKLATYKTTLGQETFFAYSSSVRTAGDQTRLSPQMYYYAGPFGLMAEYAVSSQLVGNTTKYRIANHGYEFTGSWILTGEDNSYGRVVPRSFAEVGKWRWRHALQVAVRYDVLKVDPAVFSEGLAEPSKSAQAAHEWAVGLNYYVTRIARLMFDYSQTRFAGGAPAGNRPREEAFTQRLQLTF